MEESRSQPALQLVLGSLTGEHVAITVHGRSYPTAHDDDANWLASTISIRAGAWSGTVDAYLRTEDFSDFRRRIEALSEHSLREAEFTTLEEWLTLSLTRGKLGHIKLKGRAIDRDVRAPLAPGSNCLRFRFALDQTYLPAALRQLEEIQREYPTRWSG